MIYICIIYINIYIYAVKKTGIVSYRLLTIRQWRHGHSWIWAYDARLQIAGTNE